MTLLCDTINLMMMSSFNFMTTSGWSWEAVLSVYGQTNTPHPSEAEKHRLTRVQGLKLRTSQHEGITEETKMRHVFEFLGKNVSRIAFARYVVYRDFVS